MKYLNLDHSYTVILPETSEDPAKLEALKATLSLEKENWQFDYLIRIGRVSRYETFYEPYENGIKVATGILEMTGILENLNIEIPEFLPTPGDKDPEIEGIIDSIIKDMNLPFEVRDYQREAAILALTKRKSISLMCTGSGKSLTISLILEYFRRQGKQGALIVPNINLLTQFANDIKSYGLMEVHQGLQKSGGGDRIYGLAPDKFFILTTWQSLVNMEPEVLTNLDFILCDEVHRFSSDCTSQLVLDSHKTPYKLGFTGSMPGKRIPKMTVISLFGLPTNIISSAELIAKGWGTPIKIWGTKIVWDAETSSEIGRYKDYLKKVKFLAGIDERTAMIVKLTRSLQQKAQGGTLVLYTLIEHGTSIYERLTGEPPGNLDRQKELRVFFMEGSVKGKDREEMRVFMDANPDVVMIANYSLLSTGVNIKTLRYAVFAAPLKSYTTIVQSLGRGIRQADNKEIFEVFDIADHFPGGSATFSNSYRARKKIYEGQGFQFEERKIKGISGGSP